VRPAGTRPGLEPLEGRTLLSFDPGLTTAAGSPPFLSTQSHPFLIPSHVVYQPGRGIVPYGSSGPVGYTPPQIRLAYGVDQISFHGSPGNGAGQTIAIVDAYDDPNLAGDLYQFDVKFGLPNPPSFTKINQDGGTTLPGTDPSGPGTINWEVEEALDVEWAHAMAPSARILLVEANSPQDSDLYTAVDTARNRPGVAAVSMSWGGAEFSGETSFDAHFQTPSGHAGVTFVASSGDSGAPEGYPAASPNVVSVGGTTLTLDADNTRMAESGWSGSGGGISPYEAQPAYQNGVVTQSTTHRTGPDVAYDADPSTGFAVYDSYNNGTSAPWAEWGGTSAGSPQWAALIAIADQGRALAGLGSLDGPSNTLPMIYKAPAAALNDITTGNNGFPAGPGYDLVTGLGSPVADHLIAALSQIAQDDTAPGTAVASAEQTAGQLDTFHIGSDGALYVSSVVGGGTWQGPVRISPTGIAPAGASLAAIHQSYNQLDVFFIGDDGALHVTWVVGSGTWQGPVRISPTGIAPAGASLAAARQTGDQLDVFFIGNDGAMHVSWAVGEGTWNGPVRIGPTGIAPAGASVAAAKQLDNQLDVFFVGNDQALHVGWVVGAGTWQGPVRISPTGVAPAGASVAAAKQLDNQFDVFFIGNDGAMHVSWAVGEGTWNGPVRIGPTGIAPAGASVAAAKQLDNQLDVFFVGNDGALHVGWVVGGGTWQGPVRITPTGIAPPGSAVEAIKQLDNQLDVFFVGNGGVVYDSWVVGGGTWQGPIRIE
jgi:hypothetical protein